MMDPLFKNVEKHKKMLLDRLGYYDLLEFLERGVDADLVRAVADVDLGVLFAMLQKEFRQFAQHGILVPVGFELGQESLGREQNVWNRTEELFPLGRCKDLVGQLLVARELVLQDAERVQVGCFGRQDLEFRLLDLALLHG